MFHKTTRLFILLIIAIMGSTACRHVAAQSVETTDVPTENILDNVLVAEDANVYLPAITSTPLQTSSIPDTGQTSCYDSHGVRVSCPAANSANFGQDANYGGQSPAYQSNGDGTITDLVTGLMWQQTPDRDGNNVINIADKLTYNEAVAAANAATYAGYDDWRLPTITELYSLIDFSGIDPSGYSGTDTSGLTPFIDTEHFDFGYGDTGAGERIIDAQYASSTKYVSTTMNGAETMFGVNFADGRIKGYGLSLHGSDKAFYVIFVRGNSEYDRNEFVDNGNSAIRDNATGLMWQQADSGLDYNWPDALAYCEGATIAGYDDWRLPNAKELQSIVDYGRSPDTTNSAAIDPIFVATQITNEAGVADYPAYWSSTTHANLSPAPGANAVYVNFGESMGYMNGLWIDVHGAGAQRSDPKIGNPDDYPTGHGPQGDAIRIYNYVRCVRDGEATIATNEITASTENQAQLAQDLTNGNFQNLNDSINQQSNPTRIDRQQRPNLATAAAQLGVTEDAIRSALGEPNPGPPDFAAVARALGVSEADLMVALGIRDNRGMSNNQPPTSRP